MAEYPEHEKMREVVDRSQSIGEFLDWLRDEKGIALCKWQDTIHHSEEMGDYTPEGYYVVKDGPEKLLADFFDIDLDKIEKEKQAMLDALQKQEAS